MWEFETLKMRDMTGISGIIRFSNHQIFKSSNHQIFK